MKLLPCLLLFAFLVGCAGSGNSTRLPPLPPGFTPGKTKPAPSPQRPRTNQILPPTPPGIARAAAGFAPASATPTVTPGTGILQAPELIEEPGFGKFFLARAYQGPNTVLVVEWAPSPSGPWQHVATWDCWPEEQIFFVTTTGNFQRLYLRGRHVACTPGFAPASAQRLGVAKDFKTRLGIVKAAQIEGRDVAPSFSIWKVLP